MCRYTKEQIISKFDEHIKVSGRSKYSDFFIGITDDIQQSFKEHYVRQNSWWIYMRAISHEEALEVRSMYLNKGMRGENYQFTDTADLVYCYEVTPLTIEMQIGKEDSVR